MKENVSNLKLEIYSKLSEGINIVLIYSNDNHKNVVDYAKNDYEVIRLINTQTSFPLHNLDLNYGDIVIPKLLRYSYPKYIYKQKNEVVFF